MKTFRLIPLLFVALMLFGCVAARDGSGRRWWVPTTWFSTAPATNAEHKKADENNAQEKVDEKRVEVLNTARDEVIKTGEALAGVKEESPNVEAARRTQENAETLLVQAQGAPSPALMQELRDTIAKMTSEQEADRKQGEAMQLAAEKRAVDLSKQLEESRKELETAQQALKEANEKLLASFRDRDRIANDYKTLKWSFWSAVSVASLLALGFLYYRLTRGTLLRTIIGRIDGFKDARGRSDPAVNELLSGLGNVMDGWEKRLRKKISAKVST